MQVRLLPAQWGGGNWDIGEVASRLPVAQKSRVRFPYVPCGRRGRRRHFRGASSNGERLLCTQEVEGSSPSHSIFSWSRRSAARTPLLQRGCRRFESCRDHFSYPARGPGLNESVSKQRRKLAVTQTAFGPRGCKSLPTHFSGHRRDADATYTADARLAEHRFPKPGHAGSTPARRACFPFHLQTVAQLAERLVWVQDVGGSIPSGLIFGSSTCWL